MEIISNDKLEEKRATVSNLAKDVENLSKSLTAMQDIIIMLSDGHNFTAKFSSETVLAHQRLTFQIEAAGSALESLLELVVNLELRIRALEAAVKLP